VPLRAWGCERGTRAVQALSGELDRRWDTPCWDRQCFFWATTAGTVNSGSLIIKTLPTTKVVAPVRNQPGERRRSTLAKRSKL